jgi:3'-5' exoribonuclease
MFLEDATGSIKSYAWSENLNVAFQEFDRAEVSGTIRSFNNSWIASILGAEKVAGRVDNSLQLIPKSICPLPTLLEQLDELVNVISHDALRHFVCDVVGDDQIAFPFVSVPASRHHHHLGGRGL